MSSRKTPAASLRGVRLKRKEGESWEQLFKRSKPAQGAVRETVLALHDKKQFKEITTVIEAALLRGYSEPWMYHVLAQYMKLTGRPPAEVERALLSRIDFTAVHVPSMMMSAAFLKRLDADEQALKLYKQAARLAPSRPEPYVLGLRIARDKKDWASIGWGAAGVLSYAWVKDYEKLHTEADGAAVDAYKALMKQGQRKAAAKIQSQVKDAKQRDLMLKLTWSGKGDLDLIVEEPTGTVCSYGEPQTNSGGFLLNDGSGINEQDCVERYVCPVAHSGQYKVRIRHVVGEIVGKRALLEVVLYRGTDKEVSKQVTVKLEQDDAVVQVPLARGRATMKRKKK